MAKSARRALHLGWRLLLFWLCAVPGMLCGLIPGKIVHGDIASLISGPVSLTDIAGQLMFLALPASIFWAISWFLLAILQKLEFVDTLSRKGVIWFCFGGLVWAFIWGLVVSLIGGPLVY